MLAKKYVRWILVFTAMLTAMCQRNRSGTEVILAGHTCTFSGTYQAEGDTYQGSFDCPGGGATDPVILCPYTGQPLAASSFTAKIVPTSISEEQFWALHGCVRPAESPTAVPTETPVPEPSATEPPQTQSVHMLTGRVTECSLSADGYISFLLANQLTEETFKAGIRLTLNGKEVECRSTGNTMNLLACRLPSETQFPVHIIATVGEVTTDDFSYDGSACVVHPTPQTP